MGYHGLLFGLWVLASAARAADSSASELLHRAYDVWKGGGNHGVMVMEVQTPNWTRRLTVEGWTDGGTKALIVIRAPQREKGSATLRDGAILWTWLPRAERALRIPLSMMHDSWMGSDFDYEDIVKAGTLTTDYTARFIERKAGKESERVRIECLPKAGAPVVWGKVVIAGEKLPGGGFHPDKEEYYGESGQLVRVVRLSDWRTIDGRDVPMRLECVPQGREGRRTVVRYDAIEFDQDVADDLFTLRRLQAPD